MSVVQWVLKLLYDNALLGHVDLLRDATMGCIWFAISAATKLRKSQMDPNGKCSQR